MWKETDKHSFNPFIPSKGRLRSHLKKTRNMNKSFFNATKSVASTRQRPIRMNESNPWKEICFTGTQNRPITAPRDPKQLNMTVIKFLTAEDCISRACEEYKEKRRPTSKNTSIIHMENEIQRNSIYPISNLKYFQMKPVTLSIKSPLVNNKPKFQQRPDRTSVV